jgi:hypothetical protein
LKDTIKGMDPVEALVLMEELRKYARELITFADDVYNTLPKNAELIASTRLKMRESDVKPSIKRPTARSRSAFHPNAPRRE